MKSFKTHHQKNGVWEFTVFSFTPGVICGERKVGWYDDQKFIHLKRVLERRGCLFCWNEAADNSSKNTKHTSRVEIYLKVDKTLPFSEKVTLLEPFCAMVDK